jgi:hypothetical protein
VAERRRDAQFGACVPHLAAQAATGKLSHHEPPVPNPMDANPNAGADATRDRRLMDESLAGLEARLVRHYQLQGGQHGGGGQRRTEQKRDHVLALLHRVLIAERDQLTREA